MGILENIISQEIVQRIGWMLIHFVWQAAAVALVLAILLRLLRKSSANLRYIIACSALGLMVLLPLITMRLVSVSESNVTTTEQAPIELAVGEATEIPTAEIPVLEKPARLERVAVSPKVSFKEKAISIFEPALPYMVLGWLVGVFGLSVWHLGGWTQLQRLRRQMVKPIDESLRNKLKELAELLGVKRAVEIAESALVGVPTVVGWLKPMILLPASALTGLNSEQLEAILAHELAHIKRCDYLVNMLQTVVEILGFYHPAVWWVSTKIRAERENCCDDLAVSISGDKICYARALTSMAEIRGRVPELAVAATGGSLLNRISRLLGKNVSEKEKSSWLPSVVAILLIMAMVIPTGFAISSKTDEGQNTEDRIQETGEKKFVETLANGVTVELVGVCEFEQGKVQNCWKPDGTNLDEQIYIKYRPYYPHKTFGFVFNTNQSSEITKYEATGTRDRLGRAFTVDVNDQLTELARSLQQHVKLTRIDDLYLTDIILFVAPSWQKKLIYDGKYVIEKNDPKINFIETYETGNGLNVIFQNEEREGYENRLRATISSEVAARIKQNPLVDGALRTVYSKEEGKLTSALFKNLKLSDVKYFELFTRPIPEKIVFKNVLLKPNFKTDVQVEVEGIEEIPTQQLKQLVEDFFKHNYRDITARKTIEWGEPTVDTNGNMSIRYKYEATIWDKDKIITDQLFVFDKNGELVSFNKIPPFPVGSKQWLQERVEEFFKNNYRDITARKTIEWGEPISVPNNNYSIRYKYEATIWGKDKIVQNKIFTFDANGKFVSANDVEQTIEQNSIKNSNIQTAHPQPIAYWNFDGDADDKVGNNNGTIYGATLAQGVSGQAYYFEGDGDCIEIPDSEVFDFGADGFSLSAWFRVDVARRPFPFIFNFRQNDNNPHIEVYVGGDLGSHIVPGFTRVTYREAGIDDDRWHHVAITMQNGIKDGYKLYLDGILVGQKTYSGNLRDWDTITIGAQRKSGRNEFSFKGFIDEVAVYKRALSAEEVQQLYHSVKRLEGNKLGVKADVKIEVKEPSAAENSGQKTKLQVIEDKELNLSIAIPADWSYYKNPAPGRYKFSWQLLPAKLKAWAMFIGSEGVSQADTTVRQIAIGDVAVLKSHFDKYAVRENSWAEYSICETPAVSYVADYEDEGMAMVEYRSYILGKSMVYWFVFRIEKDKFNSNKELFDSIVKSFKLKHNEEMEKPEAAERKSRVDSFRKRLDTVITTDAEHSPDGGRLTVQYAVIAVCKAAGIPYQWEKSTKPTEAECRRYIEPIHIKNKPAREAIEQILKPVGLSYGLDGNGLYLDKTPTAGAATTK